MEWLATERSRLRDLVLRALDRLMEQGADINPEELLVFAQRAVSIDPYREGAHRHLLRALALMGRRSDALTLYREIEPRLSRDLGLEPGGAERKSGGEGK